MPDSLGRTSWSSVSLKSSRRFTPARIGVFWFRVCSLDRAYGFAWIHSGLFGFFRVCMGSLWGDRGRRVYSGSLGRALGWSSSFVFAWVHSAPFRDLFVHSGSRCFTTARQGVVGFIPVCTGSLVRTPLIVGFIRVRVGLLRCA